MPTGIYERTNTENISIAAKARGVTGFLHKPHQWVILARGKTCHDVMKTTVKKEAERHFHRLKQNAKFPGRYFGARITITKDGEPYTP